MFADHFYTRSGFTYRPGRTASGHDPSPKSGVNASYDDMPNFGPSVPNVCPNCEIPIYPGTSHYDQDGCFVALKQFVKLCQDDIEESRMRDFQHPTREELMQAMREMEDIFNKLAGYSETLATHMQKLLHGKM